MQRVRRVFADEGEKRAEHPEHTKSRSRMALKSELAIWN